MIDYKKLELIFLKVSNNFDMENSDLSVKSGMMSSQRQRKSIFGT